MEPLWHFVLLAIWGAMMTPISIFLSRRYGAMDYPNQRKIHREAVPRGAGIVLWSGLLLWALLFARATYGLRLIITGATIVFFAGYLDDMLSLSPFVRLAIHFGAAGVSLLAAGELNVLYMALLLFWIAGVTNAYNFIDGMNGLALSMSFITLCFLGFAGGMLWALPPAALVAGVFFWNFPYGKTFLGDGGVYLLGYFLASLTMLWLLPMGLGFVRLCVALLLVGGVPVVDTLFVIARRVATGKSPFYPDRTHVHHRLLDKGLTCPQVLAVLCALQAFSLACAYAFLRFNAAVR